jgi:hypothetical protein
MKNEPLSDGIGEMGNGKWNKTGRGGMENGKVEMEMENMK